MGGRGRETEQGKDEQQEPRVWVVINKTGSRMSTSQRHQTAAGWPRASRSKRVAALMSAALVPAQPGRSHARPLHPPALPPSQYCRELMKLRAS